MSFSEEARRISIELSRKGHQVLTAPYTDKSQKELDKMLSDKENYINNLKPEFIREHFDNILRSDAILVINMEKNGIKNYVGGSTLAEIMFAFYNNKKIFILNPVPDVSYKDEILSVKPIVINGNLDLIS